MLKSKHCYFFNITLPWMQILRLRRCRCIRNHGFLHWEKFQALKFMFTEVICKNIFLCFLEMHNCVWYLWTCPIANYFWKLSITPFKINVLKLFQSYIKVKRYCLLKKLSQRLIYTTCTYQKLLIIKWIKDGTGHTVCQSFSQ